MSDIKNEATAADVEQTVEALEVLTTEGTVAATIEAEDADTTAATCTSTPEITESALAPPLAPLKPVEADDTDNAQETSDESPAQETTTTTEVVRDETPTFDGLLSYRKTSATLPFYHKRYFYFSENPIPLHRLHAFYEKHKKLKVDKDELDHLVAHTVTTGAGLFFYSKSTDGEAVPSGILECHRMTEIKTDDHMRDRFSIVYDGKAQGFHFETGATSRESWIRGIAKMKLDSVADLENIQSSEIYRATLKALQEGTAFDKVESHAEHTDVLSDEENAVAAPTAVTIPEEPAVESDKNDVPKSKRASAFLTSLKDKIPHEKPSETSGEEGPITPEKTTKKEKRKSFLSGFMSRRESPVLNVAQTPNEGATEETTERVQGIDVSEATLATAQTTSSPAESETKAKDAPKSPLSPLKGKVDGFFSLVRKFGEKDGSQTREATATPKLDENAAESEAAVEPASVPSGSATAEDTLKETPDSEHQEPGPDAVTDEAADRVEAMTSETPIATPSPQAVPEKRPGGLGRKLTGLFRGRKQTKAQTSTSSLVTSPEPPQIPESVTDAGASQVAEVTDDIKTVSKHPSSAEEESSEVSTAAAAIAVDAVEKRDIPAA